MQAETHVAGGHAGDAIENGLRNLLAGCNALVLEDEAVFYEPVVRALRRYDFSRVDLFHTVPDAIGPVTERTYDVILLDRMVPGGDGLDVLRALRSREGAAAKTPALFLTSLADDLQRVAGLMAGADDYVPKPVNELELIARVAAQVRRSRWGGGQKRQHGEELLNGPLRLSRARRTLYFGDEPISIQRQGFDMLAVLMEHAGEPLTPLMLFEKCWPHWSFLPDQWEGNVYQAITRIRRALAETEASLPQALRPLVVNLRGDGYMLRDLGEAT